MIKVLIGHRGVGKSALLERLKKYFASDSFFDLDKEIELATNNSISDLFNEFGEAKFREIEIQTFNNLIHNKNSSNTWISLGAGFDLTKLDNSVEKIWIKRATDKYGRVFFNRPRLIPDLSPLDEYKKLFTKRDSFYLTHSNYTYLMSEGLNHLDEIEKSIFTYSYDLSLAAITLHKKNLNCLKDNFKYFELRDDIFTDLEIESIKNQNREKKFIYSSRKSKDSFYKNGQNTMWDWPLEFGPNSESNILSLHEREESFSQTLFKLERAGRAGQHLKLAVEVNNFSEIFEGIKWQNSDPLNRSFLPRSKNGRWQWVRQYLKGRQDINFLRTDEGSSLDQPTLYQWLRTPDLFLNFSAVLGCPIEHSHSPQYHAEYFAKKNMPFFAIEMDSDEFAKGIEVLDHLGLCAAAVTSPLKKHAFRFSTIKSNLVNDLTAVNTLTKNHGQWSGDNTDLFGFEELVRQVSKNIETIIWGGCGTLNVIQKIFPQSRPWSASAGKPRNSADSSIDCELLIWAAGPEANLPPIEIRPKLVVDLNYREDSRAREFAILCGAEYISGIKMFLAQAKLQQKIWDVL